MQSAHCVWPPFQHSGPLSPAQLTLSANTLQDTTPAAGMRREGLAVTPTITQRHVGSLAKVSVCQVWLDNAYALSEQPFPWPAPNGKPLVLSAFACKLSRSRSTYAHTSFKSLQHRQACAAADATTMLWVLVQVWPFYPACNYRKAVSCGQALT
jgi:hypothetical protein